MPTYEYLCKACGRTQEIFQKITAEPLKECPECHKPELTRLISGGNFQLKGSGWYVTDIRDKAKPKPKDQDSGSTSETKSDTKSSDTNTKNGT